MSHITVQKGIDNDGNIKPTGITGTDNDALKVYTDLGHLMEDLITEVKIINLHLEQLTEAGYEDKHTEQ